MSDDKLPQKRIDWRGADLRNANMSGLDLVGVDFRAADLRGVNFSSSNLKYADLRGAQVQAANFQNANLYAAKLQGIEADQADFRNADLRMANLGGAYLSGALMPEPQRPPAADYQNLLADSAKAGQEPARGRPGRKPKEPER